MGNFKKTVLEALTLGVIATAIAFAINGVRAKGSVEFSRNYFPQVKAVSGATDAPRRLPPATHAATKRSSEIIPEASPPQSAFLVRPPEGGQAEGSATCTDDCARQPFRHLTFEEVVEIYNDPDTERWFLYWNSSNAYPLHAIELDKDRRLAYRGTPKWLFGLDPERHGWERFGQDHRDTTTRPFIEGAWMTKHAGRYYLQYGAPGTEYNVYATGVYVGDSPLGPFTYAPYNPVAYKPGGFVQGAGHGNTFQDVHGNWWNTGTPWIGVNWNFERRIALHPAGFDGDGQLYVDTRFGDFPRRLPTGPWRSAEDLFTGWMLLSYRKPATASSALDSFPASNTTDENPRSYWVADRNRPGEWLTVDLGGEYEVKAIQVNYADFRSGRYGSDSTVVTRFRLAASTDGQVWRTVADLSGEQRDRPNAYVELAAPVGARFVRYEHVHVGAAHLAISDLRVFGNASPAGRPPATPEGLTADREPDERNAVITWRPVPGVVGYNVRWGIAPTKLYQTYQRFADQGTTLELRSLTVGQAYWVAVESFDESGVSALSAAVPIR